MIRPGRAKGRRGRVRVIGTVLRDGRRHVTTVTFLPYLKKKSKRRQHPHTVLKLPRLFL